MSQPFVRLYRLVRDFGLTETFFRLLHRLRIISVLHSFNFTFKELGVRDGVLILNSLDDVGGPKVCEINGFKIFLREICEGELESLNFAKEMFSLETFREHFGRGMRFFAAFHEGIVISVNGVHTKHAHLTHVRLPAVRLPQGVAYSNCALTSPKYRNFGVGTLLRTYLLNKMWQEGYRSVVGAVFTDNPGALRWNATNGFQYWGKIHYVRCLNKDFWFRQLTKVGKQHKTLFDNVESDADSAPAMPAEVTM